MYFKKKLFFCYWLWISSKNYFTDYSRKLIINIKKFRFDFGFRLIPREIIIREINGTQKAFNESLDGKHYILIIRLKENFFEKRFMNSSVIPMTVIINQKTSDALVTTWCLWNAWERTVSAQDRHWSVMQRIAWVESEILN